MFDKDNLSPRALNSDCAKFLPVRTIFNSPVARRIIKFNILSGNKFKKKKYFTKIKRFIPRASPLYTLSKNLCDFISSMHNLYRYNIILYDIYQQQILYLGTHTYTPRIKQIFKTDILVKHGRRQYLYINNILLSNYMLYVPLFICFITPLNSPSAASLCARIPPPRTKKYVYIHQKGSKEIADIQIKKKSHK